MGRHRTLAAFAALALTAACTRSDDTTSGGTTTAPASGSTTTAAASADDPTALANGGFGDIAGICQEGDAGAGGATDVGVTADEIRLATFTDKGFTGRPGLTKEMHDAAVAFAAWCNEHGGILGREVVVDDRDAAIVAYNNRILESCDEDFAMVGGGAVLDDSDAGRRIECGLPNVAGYVVSPTARVADLQVQPVPTRSTPCPQARTGGWRRSVPR